MALDSHPTQRCSHSCLTRRAVLTGTAVGAATLLGACSTYGDESDTASAAATTEPTAAQTTGDAAGGATGGPAATQAAPALAAIADVPVGGGLILEDKKIVLTQPQAGTIKAFSAVCTHQGCTVAEVSDGLIKCPCHGSKFKVADGSVDNGPATRPLPPVAVAVDGDQIRSA